MWCPGTSYPEAYRDTYFVADFASGWIKQVIFDANDRPVEVRNFEQSAGPVVAMAADPVSGDLYYIAYDDFGNGLLNRVRYAANTPPTAIGDAAPRYGPAPLTVQFSGEQSSDAEGGDVAQFLMHDGDSSGQRFTRIGECD